MGGILMGSLDVDGNLILLASHGMVTEDDTTMHWGADIARYHVATQQLEWVTNDLIRKGFLGVLPTRKKASD